MKIQRLTVTLLLLSIFMSCAVERHILVPVEPVKEKKRSDFSQTDFILTSFRVYNLDIRDNAQDIAYLRNKFIRYLAAQNNFRTIFDVNIDAKIPDDKDYVNVEVAVYPDYSKYRTYILDIPFFYPAIGYWPLTPLWGTATVKVRCDIYNRKNKLIKSIQVDGSEKYLMIFYSWYRTKPIKDALRKAYEKAFIKTAKALTENRNLITRNTDSLKIEITQPQNVNFTKNVIDSLKKSIAVLNLNAYGISNSDALALTNRLTTELFKTKHFNVVEREKTDEILDEQGFQLSGCTTSECLVEAGKLLNVELMLGGSISKVGNYYSIELRIIDVESGAILAVASVDIEGKIGKVLTSGIKKAVQKIIQ